MDVLFEVQGMDVAFTGAQTVAAPVTWSQSLVETIMEIPPIQTMGVDIDGGFRNGGRGLMVVECAEWVNDRKSSPVTTLTSTLAVGDITANVTDTSAFPSSGTFWVDQEAISYSGKTATTFTGLVRGALATWEQEHRARQAPANTSKLIYGFNPVMDGRKCWIHTFDPQDPINTKATIAVGYIDGISFSRQGFSFNLLSIAQQLENDSICTGSRAKGVLRGTLQELRGHTIIGGNFKANTSDLIVGLEDPETPWPYDETAPAGKLVDVANVWVQVEDEVILARKTAYPAWSRPVNNVDVSSFGPRIQSIVPPFLRVGDSIQFTDSVTSKVIDTTIVRIEGDYLTHAATGFAPAVASMWSTPGLQRFTGLERGVAGTIAKDHDPNAECSQVYVQEADWVDGTLQLLHSGNGSGNDYDVLPDWVGAGLLSTEIDTDSFDSLRLYSLPRLIVLGEPKTAKSFLVDLAKMTGGRIFVSHEGKVKARRDFSIYPDTDSVFDATIDTTGGIPAWQRRTQRLFNHWVWNMVQRSSQGPKGKATATFELESSSALYGKRSFPAIESEALVVGIALGMAETFAISTLMRYAVPTPEITVDVPEEVSNILEPGQIARVTYLHLPDQQGGEGLTSELYEIMHYSPSGAKATVRLLQLPPQGNVGLFAPAMVVQGVSGSDITVEPASVTHLAPTQSKLGTPLTSILGPGQDGTEDVHWFLQQDTVELIDVSTLGNATATTASTNISTIDYATRIITLGAKPAWLAAGDIIRLGDHASTASGFKSNERLPYFLWWANNTPVVGASSEPYIWGM